MHRNTITYPRRPGKPDGKTPDKIQGRNGYIGGGSGCDRGEEQEIEEDGEKEPERNGGREAGGLIGRKLSARAILRRIRDSPGSYPSRPLLDSSDVHRLPTRRGSPFVANAFHAETHAYHRVAMHPVEYVAIDNPTIISDDNDTERSMFETSDIIALTPMMVFSSVMVTCLALSTAVATCC